MTHIFAIINSFEWMNHWKQVHRSYLSAPTRIALLITGSCTDSHVKSIKSILHGFWQREMLNVIAITPTQDLPLIHTYNPFLVGTENPPGELMNLTSEFFPDKLKNLHKYPVRIAFYENPPYVYPKTHPAPMDGGDYALMTFLSERLNFTMKSSMKQVTFADTFFQLSNRKRTAAIGDLLMRDTDILGNSFYLESINGQELDILYPRWRTALVVIVPRTRPIRGILNMFSSVDLTVVILFFIVMILLVVYLRVEKDTHIFIHVWRLLIYQHFDFIGTRASERLFCISFVIWSFFLVEFYEGRLVNDLSSSFYKDIKTLRGLIDSKLTVLVPSWQQTVLSHSSIQERMELVGQLEVEGNFTKCAQRAVEAGDVGCTMDANAADYFKDHIAKNAYEETNDGTVKGQLRVMEESLMSFWRLHATRKRFFLKDKLNEVIGIIQEGGLLKKWESDEKDRQFREHVEEQKESVGMDKMGAAFQLLMYGHCLATGQLLIELAWHAFKKNHLRGWDDSEEAFVG
ncbi:uncharacterized protein LOC114841538 [Diachasma alloeum]|uniref:Ionotropic receptor 137PSE n=1 Tax=Diachasma alloeum TaxID=454923 RepID=A0A4E0RZ50_9HYME|nr:uncharacterized protein LOC114841538 [Diachasma alloeum]THK33191.1 ionotropic receptor 137PSE [Diachasma alloeum]